METAFDSLVYESDNISEVSDDTQLNKRRGGRRSTRPRKSLNTTLNEPKRRSTRILSQSYATVEEKRVQENETKHTKLKRATMKEFPNQTDFDDRDIGTIVGATEVDGELKFVFKWKDSGDSVMLNSQEAKIKYPYALIDFYESCMVWETESSDSEDQVDG